ncbi:primosomal protein N' [Corynebacterium diphtheriae]|uniref:primosomal protein N' n=1 Tax=Corynebacterium diphtheriae TaxID=1717 RepID=UPI001241B2B5|nr:primosomal protein N' [Corynebacterium diphtheriae]VVH30068.1 putative primosomal protein N' [Corynebacterium diphtheriae]
MSKTRVAASSLPVARVLPLLGVAHLDRVFEYLVDSTISDDAQPGVKVRVRFGGRLVDGIILERTSGQEHEGRLAWLDKVQSSVPVYTPALRRLIESLSTRYAGITSDVIRSAIPSRHAKVEEGDFSTSWDDLGDVDEPDLSMWAKYVHGKSFVDAVIACQTARAAWQIAPGENWAAAIAALGTKVAIAGGGVLIVVPDQRDVETLEAAFRGLVSARQITVMTSAQGPQARYRRFLSILHGQGRIVVGTRSAAFAPVVNLQLAVIKDDGDENLVDPRSPYIHAREVLSTRSTQEHCSLILAGHSRSTEAQLLVQSGWAHNLVVDRERVRKMMPRIHAVADTNTALERDPLARAARIPSAAFSSLRDALKRNRPVLIHVPRKGYIPVLACQQCRSAARCRYCNGPLELPFPESGAPQTPQCRWCGRPDSHFRCTHCGSSNLRAIVLGAERTAEEIGRAFPQTRVVVSGGNRVHDTIPDAPIVVVATPGAEPEIADDGRYGAAVLLDTWALLSRQDLRASEDTLAKWFSVCTLVEPCVVGGEVVVVADAGLFEVQALIRWDPIWAASRELELRQEVHFPPAAHMAAIDGARDAIDEFLDMIQLPDHAEILGPVSLPAGNKLPGEYDENTYGPPQRVLIRIPLKDRNELGEVLRSGIVQRSAKRKELPLRVKIDPIHVG